MSISLMNQNANTWTVCPKYIRWIATDSLVPLPLLPEDIEQPMLTSAVKDAADRVGTGGGESSEHPEDVLVSVRIALDPPAPCAESSIGSRVREVVVFEDVRHWRRIARGGPVAG